MRRGTNMIVSSNVSNWLSQGSYCGILEIRLLWGTILDLWRIFVVVHQWGWGWGKTCLFFFGGGGGGVGDSILEVFV